MTNTNKPIIQTVDLKKNFGDLEVLKGISQSIYEGEVISIIGPSGGGKSTFLRCLNLLEEPTSGEVYFEGNKLDSKSFNYFFKHKYYSSPGNTPASSHAA